MILYDNSECSVKLCLKPPGIVTWVQCDACKMWFHLPCLEIKLDQVKLEEKNFFCLGCEKHVKKREKYENINIESICPDEEPLFVSPGEEAVMPDYSGAKARCSICRASFRDIIVTVLHIKEEHGVVGGPQIPMVGEC